MFDRPQRERLYISTAIPYVNARPHVGFAFEAVLADAIARYHRARERDVFFLTGTDDNSLKNVEAAELRGIPTGELVEENAERFMALKDALDLSFDDFLRTSTDPRHSAAVAKIWRACSARGDIYRGRYTGLYCVGCEDFYAREDLVDGRCPEHLRPLEQVDEDNWFFRLSRYQPALIDLVDREGLRILPESRRAEILGFLRRGLRDISISRPTQRSRGWGLPVPGDPSQVVYVWFDALTNYISALDYASEGPLYESYWVDNPARIHLIGKGILRFHAAYWPAMLMSAGIPLPSTILVHGYLTTEGRKISKSLGDTADPHELSRALGADALRYYLLSQLRPAHDGDFSAANLRVVYEHDLADQLGNLVSRVASMVQRYAEGRVPPRGDAHRDDSRLIESTNGILQDVDAAMANFEIDRAVQRVWDVVREANRYVVEQRPWDLARDPALHAQRRLSSVLYNLVEAIRIVTAFGSAFIPSKAAEIASVFSIDEGWNRLTERTTTWGTTSAGSRVHVSGPIFPKSIASPPNEPR